MKINISTSEANIGDVQPKTSPLDNGFACGICKPIYPSFCNKLIVAFTAVVNCIVPIIAIFLFTFGIVNLIHSIK